MTPWMLLAATYCCVSGGPYGLEPVIGEAGAGLGLLLILALPLFWALPDALTTAEMAPMLPVEGGYIRWVRRALGPAAGFLNAWWTWLYNLTDAAIYPVLFATYLNELVQLFGGRPLTSLGQWGAGIGVIALFSWMNIRGIRLVGRTSQVLTVAIILPFLVLGYGGLVRILTEDIPLQIAFLPEGKNLSQAMAGGLAFALWNYLGWDQLSTVAEEVQQPEKAYPFAILWGIPLVTLVYVVPVGVSLFFAPHHSSWQEGSWPTLGQTVGGDWLGQWLAVTGMISPIALFGAVLLASSRIPNVMSEDGWAPAFLSRLHPKYGTPANSILLHAAVFTALSWKGFADLVAMNVMLYCSALFLEGLSLLVLRVREPDLPRPFRIRGGWPALLAVWLLPTILGGVLVWSEVLNIHTWTDFLTELGPTAIALLSGPVVYLFVRASRESRQSSES